MSIYPGEPIVEVPGYKLGAALGSSSISTTYAAERVPGGEPVALKLFRPLDLDERRIQRFFLEADILLKLSHPGVARLHQTGMATTPEGIRYFHVVELVHGQPLLQYASERALTPRQRIETMLRICDVIAYIHRKGVLHRNLKPETILIESSGQPKLIDFGLARVLTGSQKLTAPGQIIGNLTYMSPEQTRGVSAELDERVDVYALGGIGYTLLAGKPPLDFSGMSLDDALKALLETAPEPLSKIDPAFAGELERIFACALAKDKAERHRSVEELAADFEQFLRSRA